MRVRALSAILLVSSVLVAGCSSASGAAPSPTKTQESICTKHADFVKRIENAVSEAETLGNHVAFVNSFGYSLQPLNSGQTSEFGYVINDSRLASNGVFKSSKVERALIATFSQCLPDDVKAYLSDDADAFEAEGD